MPKSAPWYPHKGVTWSNLYFFIKNKTFNMNPFDKDSTREAKQVILAEAREASPNYKMFIQAATMATGLSERSIKKILYKEKI